MFNKTYPDFLTVFKAVIYLWAAGGEVTQHAVARHLGYRETKYVWNHINTLIRIGVLKKITHAHQHVELILCTPKI